MRDIQVLLMFILVVLACTCARIGDVKQLLEQRLPPRSANHG